MNKHIIKVDKSKCIGCSMCKKDCPVNNINIVDKKAVIIEQSCIECGHCVAVCPKAAITMSGYDEEPVEFEIQPTLDPIQLINAIKSRRTVRQFKDKEVSSDIVNQIIEVGRMTPTGKNAQNVSYIVLKNDKEKYEKMAVNFLKKIQPIIGLFYKKIKEVKIDDNFFFKKASVAIMVVSKDKVNASLAASNMALMAESNKLGVLYSGFFSLAANKSKELRKELNLNKKDKVVTTLVIGHPNVKYYRTAQRDAANIRFL